MDLLLAPKADAPRLDIKRDSKGAVVVPGATALEVSLGVGCLRGGQQGWGGAQEHEAEEDGRGCHVGGRDCHHMVDHR